MPTWGSSSERFLDRRTHDPHTRAVQRALEGDAKLKYFQHAGALLTADGSDDELIKFEGVPDGYVLKVP